jgi:hypothetical protein
VLDIAPSEAARRIHDEGLRVAVLRAALVAGLDEGDLLRAVA